MTLAPPPSVSGKRVVLKPNFVEFYQDRPVTTSVELLRALVRTFRDLGAREVIVGEGPGHRRDTDEVWTRSGLFKAAQEDGFRVVDLNVDRLRKVEFKTIASGGEMSESLIQSVYLPETIVSADILVSVPKLKTHHHVGCTLSQKNLFGVLPGIKYGWPKNILHFNGIPRSIIELNGNIPISYAVIDGVVGMEGDGPIMGSPVSSNCLVMGRSRLAVDWAGASLMGIDPAKVDYLLAAAKIGFGPAKAPQYVGESFGTLRKEYRLTPKWEFLRG
jgi:uncharacterized protein (DUF362 family)